MRETDPSLIRAMRGPVTLITVGVLFALNNFTPYQFHQTWPVLLIVFGLLSLMRRTIEPPPPAGPAGYAPQYNYQPPAPPPPAAASGGYRQSTYNEQEPPAGPAKGGFGSTAKPGETEGGSV
jgi:hypothetical protein